jgi:hypothetical protein
MQSRISDKELLYSMLKREVANLTQGVPFASAFHGSISNYLINLIDPYVSAFIEGGELDSEQLSEFASEEVNSKIMQFKKRYESLKGNKDYED